ncbi:MAG TPA: PP2C family protein-serine/threonine phosphatase [Thermoanaerobaculia bacterium]
MPSGKDWGALLKATFHRVGREDIVGLFSREWQHAKGKLTASDREAIDREPRRWKRFFKTANSVLFGLSQRLAPARRVLFLAVLVFLIFSIQGPSFSHDTERIAHGVRKTTEYHFYFDNFWLSASCVLLFLLLSMELVDKINYRDELELARDLQASLIPRELPTDGAWELGAHNEIANTVGGDIYDFVPLPNGRLAALFGDASGHGMTAGLVMAVAHAAFRTQLDVDPSPQAVFATLNRILCRTGGPRAFFGCVYLLLAADGEASACVAGHPPILHIGADGAVRERIGRGAYPLGIRAGLSWPVETLRVAPGEALFLNSDGLSEARNASDQEFGDARVEAAIRRAASLPAPALADEVAADMHRFLGVAASEDDVSVAVIRRRV